MRKLIFILLSLLAVISLTACSDSSSSSGSSNTPPPQTSPKGVTPLNVVPVASSFTGADVIDIIYRVDFEHAGYSYYLVDKNGTIQNKLSNNVNDVNNMYNIKVGPEYISDAVSTNSVVISIPSTRFTQVGDAQNEANIPYGTKITAIDSNIEVIEGTTKLADISGTKPSVDLLTYAEMTQGYFSGCSEATNICRSEFTRFPDSSAVVITPTRNTKYENGVISFATSTVNLGDLNSDSDRVLGNNWGDSQFLYSGDLYQTSTGGELLQAIQSQGENVYSDEPEYSYYLTPSTLSAIRDYNDQYGYEVNYNNLRVYGSYAIRSLCDNDSASNDCWEVGPDDEYISFQHYGSSFLEDYMPELGAAYSGLLTENEVNGSCFVMAGEADNMEKIQEKVDSGCRWVDYVQEADGKYFRLAFK